MIAEKEPISNKEQILTRLVEQYQLQLLKMCRMYLPDSTSAEDAVQETFIKAYKALPSFRGECSEKTWLMRIALNTCRDITRTGWFKHIDKRIVPEDLTNLTAPEESEISDLAAEISSLPRKLKDAVLLYYYQNMTVEEVAQALNTSPATISRRLNAARTKLRNLLEGGNAYEG